MSTQEALCQRIVITARILRESPLSGAPLAAAADHLEDAMAAVDEHRLDDAGAILARLNGVRCELPAHRAGGA